jgi:hypothetical protein
MELKEKVRTLIETPLNINIELCSNNLFLNLD